MAQNPKKEIRPRDEDFSMEITPRKTMPERPKKTSDFWPVFFIFLAAVVIAIAAVLLYKAAQ